VRTVGAPDVRMKPASERGKYLFPGGFGRSAESSMWRKSTRSFNTQSPAPASELLIERAVEDNPD